MNRTDPEHQGSRSAERHGHLCHVTRHIMANLQMEQPDYFETCICKGGYLYPNDYVKLNKKTMIAANIPSLMMRANPAISEPGPAGTVFQ